jgi:hypothetical protein
MRGKPRPSGRGRIARPAASGHTGYGKPMQLTFKYRIKDKHSRHLNEQARAVNQ